MILLFFFSSRRRHTRLQGDWSSDVCSSDLVPAQPEMLPPPQRKRQLHLEQLHARSGHALHARIGKTPLPDAQKRRTARTTPRSEEHTSELQSPCNLVCRLLLEKKNKIIQPC